MSIFIKDPRSCFIHIPKTGGESVNHWLSAHLNASFAKGEKHASYKKMQSKHHKDLGFTFTIIRNPWDRIVSGYHYYKDNNKRILRLNQIESFSEFLRFGKFGITLSKTQHSLIGNDIDLILNFENLAEEFYQIQDFYNVKNPLPYKNKSTHEHYSYYYTHQWMIDIVAKRYQEDIDCFNYEFEYK